MGKKNGSENLINNLKGQTFGRWTVLEMSDKKANNGVYWKCKCSCGEARDVVGHRLTSGYSRSCGCINKERAEERKKVRVPLKRTDQYSWSTQDELSYLKGLGKHLQQKKDRYIQLLQYQKLIEKRHDWGEINKAEVMKYVNAEIERLQKRGS